MIRMLVRIGMFLASSAIGLLAADLLLERVNLKVGSFFIVVALFTVLQALVAPGCAKLMRRNSDALVSMVGLASTVVALVIATLISDGLSIRGIGTWIWASLIVWVITAAATYFIPKLVVRTKLGAKAGLGRRSPAGNTRA